MKSSLEHFLSRTPRRFKAFVEETMELLRRLGEQTLLAYPVERSGMIDVIIGSELTINASVKWRPSTQEYRITIEWGTFIWAYRLCCFMASLDAEQENSFAGERIFATNFTADNVERVLELLVQADQQFLEEQTGFGRYIFKTILIAVFYHEIAHILGGHLGLLSQEITLDSIQIDELSFGEISKEPLSGRFPVAVYEYDADRLSGLLIANLAANQTPSIYEWSLNKFDRNIVFSLWSLSMYALSTIETRKLAEGYSKSRYPSPFLRFSSIMSGITSALNIKGYDNSTSDNICIGCLSILAHYELHYPIVGEFRDFTDVRWRKTLEVEVEELLSDYYSFHIAAASHAAYRHSLFSD